MQKTLIVLGLIILIAGLFWPVLIKFPFGKLPGDIIIEKPNFKIYIPVSTMLLFSAVISLLLWLIRKF
ncbi:MAG: DUF2905 domain-containing protein [Ignavibacteriaceae bacterium]|nr:DUF2905 domain-containing protein [Ignavibacteriaceae bacterium]